MIGSIIGDIAGAPYEGDRLGQDRRDYIPFYLNGLAKFTDDTNLTIAVADAILNSSNVATIPFEQKYIKWYNKNPNLGYGSAFKVWANDGGGYRNDSWANGAAMRVSPIVLLQNNPNNSIESNIDIMFETARQSVLPTHNCDESRVGALAIVTAMFLASLKIHKDKIKTIISELTNYDLTASVEEVRETWDKRNIRCNITVPQALICFFESENFEDAIRLSIYSKGDTDTIAAMAGGIAEWYYGVETIDPLILTETKSRLQPEMIDIINVCYRGTLKW